MCECPAKVIVAPLRSSNPAAANTESGWLPAGAWRPIIIVCRQGQIGPISPAFNKQVMCLDIMPRDLVSHTGGLTAGPPRAPPAPARLKT